MTKKISWVPSTYFPEEDENFHSTFEPAPPEIISATCGLRDHLHLNSPPTKLDNLTNSKSFETGLKFTLISTLVSLSPFTQLVFGPMSSTLIAFEFSSVI